MSTVYTNLEEIIIQYNSHSVLHICTLLKGEDCYILSENNRQNWKTETTVIRGGVNETRDMYKTTNNLAIIPKGLGNEKWNKLI